MSGMHPADPSSAVNTALIPNLDQPNALLSTPQPPNAYPAVEESNGLSMSQLALRGLSGIPVATPAFAQPQNRQPVQFLDPATLSTYSIQAQEILTNASQNPANAKGTPEWEAAREEVLRSVGSRPASDPPPQPPRGRGRPRGRPRKIAAPLPTETRADVAARASPAVPVQISQIPHDAASFPTESPTTHTPAPAQIPPIPSIKTDSRDQTPVRGRGRGRPRGRMSTRGGKGGKIGKRKRNSDDEDSEGDTSDSETHILESTTFTKSGRSVTKPTAYNPLPIATETPPGSAGTSKRKRTYRGGLETALCVKCDRGHSILQNVIVFCDGCNKAWHQWCHDPHIPTEVTNIPEAQWFCSMCSHEREMAGCPLEQRVGGEVVGLTLEEANTYFSTLSHITLRHLLVRAVELQWNLPIFAPNARQLIKGVAAPSTLPTSLLSNTKQNGSTHIPTSHPTPAVPQSTHSQYHPTTSSSTAPHAAASASSRAAAPITIPHPPTRPPHLQPLNNPSTAALASTSATPSLSALSFTHASISIPTPTSPTALSTSSLSSDAYFDYDNPFHDPPYTYPRPGTGPMPLEPITHPDDAGHLKGKESENAGVFSHLVREEGGGTGLSVWGVGDGGRFGEGAGFRGRDGRGDADENGTGMGDVSMADNGNGNGLGLGLAATDGPRDSGGNPIGYPWVRDGLPKPNGIADSLCPGEEFT